MTSGNICRITRRGVFIPLLARDDDKQNAFILEEGGILIPFYEGEYEKELREFLAKHDIILKQEVRKI